jgi:hypothetical protein
MDPNSVRRTHVRPAQTQPAYKKVVDAPKSVANSSAALAKSGSANVLASHSQGSKKDLLAEEGLENQQPNPQAGATQQAALIRFQLQGKGLQRGRGENIQLASNATQDSTSPSSDQPAAKAPEQPAAKAPDQPAEKAPDQKIRSSEYDLILYPDPRSDSEKGSAKDAIDKAEEIRQKKFEEDLKKLEQYSDSYKNDGIIAPEIVQDFVDFGYAQESQQLKAVGNDLENIAGNKLTLDEIIKAQKALFSPGEGGQVPSLEEINSRLEAFKAAYPDNQSATRDSGIRNNTVPNNTYVLFHLMQMADRYRTNPSQAMIDLLNNDFENRRARLNGMEQTYQEKASQITENMLGLRSISEKAKNGFPLTAEEKKRLEPQFEQFITMKEMKVFEAAAQRSSLIGALDGEQLRVHPIDSPDLSSHWPKNVQIHTATNQSNPAIFRQHVSDFILAMSVTDSMTEAAIKMRDEGSFVDIDNKNHVSVVTPLVSTNMTSENAIWQKDDPNVKRRVVLNIVNDNSENYQDEWVQRDLDQMEAALHSNYDLPGAPVEIITIRGKTKAEIQEAVEKLGASAGSDTEIMINFHHHGLDPQESRSSLPSFLDFATDMSNVALGNEAQAQGTAEGKIAVGETETITETELKQWLKAMENSGGVLIYFDSCYGGALAA